jgi:hypothetical protein
VWVPTQLRYWSIAFIEGFSTLAVEVIAIRLAVPIVGSSITLTGVMLGVVLLALSGGYWRGGVVSARWDRPRTRSTLARNLMIAAVLYGALAFPLEARLLEGLLDRNFALPMAIGATAILLYLLPIYFASQTVPMLAELTNVDGHAGRASGRVLFFSTLGSVAGGVVTPVWLFPAMGVRATTYLVFAMLAIAAAATIVGQANAIKIAVTGAVAIALLAGGQRLRPTDASIFAFDSAYQSIRVDVETTDDRDERVLHMGGGRASGIFIDTGEASFGYVLEAERALAATVAEARDANVLQIGAAGFIFPRDAARLAQVGQIDAVDVDPVVKGIAEREFLRAPLPAKVRFVPLSARYAARRLHAENRRYQFVFLDAFFGQSIPEELVTLEFFRDLRAISDHVAVNVIMDRGLNSYFARNLLAGFREAFGGVWCKVIAPDSDFKTGNILVTNWAWEGAREWKGNGTAYRDDRNRADREYIDLVWGGV